MLEHETSFEAAAGAFRSKDAGVAHRVMVLPGEYYGRSTQGLHRNSQKGSLLIYLFLVVSRLNVSPFVRKMAKSVLSAPGPMP